MYPWYLVYYPIGILLHCTTLLFTFCNLCKGSRKAIFVISFIADQSGLMHASGQYIHIELTDT